MFGMPPLNHVSIQMDDNAKRELFALQLMSAMIAAGVPRTETEVARLAIKAADELIKQLKDARRGY